MDAHVKERRNVEIEEDLTGVEYLKSRFFMASIAEAIGMTSGAIAQWTIVPEARVLEVSKATDVPPHKIRPDLYEGYAPVRRKSC